MSGLREVRIRDGNASSEGERAAFAVAAQPFGGRYFGKRHPTRAFQVEVCEIIRALAPAAGQLILDVGCGGRGLLARPVRASALALPFLREAFDRVVAQHLIEHLNDPTRGVAEWRRWVRPHGPLVVVTPNVFYPQPDLYADPTHVRIFCLEQMVSLLSTGGFEVVMAKTLMPRVVVRWGRDRNLGVRFNWWFSRLPPLRWRGQSILLAAEQS